MKNDATRSTTLIREGEQSAFERWELPHVESPEARTRREAKKERVEDVGEEEGRPQPVTAEQIEAIQKEAYQEGFELGHKEGLKSGQAEVQANAQRLAQAARALARPLEELDQRLEEELVTLSIAVARQLVRRELQTQPDEVVAVVREAIQALPYSASQVKVFLHPDDVRLIRETLRSSEEESQPWKIVEDPVLTRGGCRVETDRSRINATVEKRLNAVIARLLGGERETDGEALTE